MSGRKRPVNRFAPPGVAFTVAAGPGSQEGGEGEEDGHGGNEEWVQGRVGGRSQAKVRRGGGGWGSKRGLGSEFELNLIFPPFFRRRGGGSGGGKKGSDAY